MLNDKQTKLLLVGDNPFHNISHLSQERARSRTEDPSNPKYAANLIMTASTNGANGFTFSICEKTLAILKELDMHDAVGDLHLYPIIPYAFEYVRLANQFGITGLTKSVGKELVKSMNVKSLSWGLRGLLTFDLKSIVKAYLSYEISRVRSSTSVKELLDSMLLHQLITDMALALDLDWVFKEYVDFLSSRKIVPGFNTGNFPVLVRKFCDWNIDLGKVIIAAPFNKLGFQMIPSMKECEKVLCALPKANVIAISVLAAGYLPLEGAAEYIRDLPNVKGVAIGISKQKHAEETFSVFRKRFSTSYS